uniref:Transposase Tc1-like domain-containing protein n=1 Tax=Monopterus albus TaxID=43700 RepID=A0A3Q3J1W1_MONAL
MYTVLKSTKISENKISKQTGYSRCSIQGVLKKYEESGEVKDKNRSGRARKLSKSDERFLRVSSLKAWIESGKDLAQHLAASSGCQADPPPVRRSLIRNGLCGRTAAKKPLFQKETGRKSWHMQKLTKM